MNSRTLALIAALAGTGCTGEIGTAVVSGASGDLQRGSSASVDSRGAAVAYAPAYVPRLTQEQYVNGVRDLLGDVAASAAEKLDLDDPVGESDHTFRTMRATTNGLVDIAAEHVSTTAFDVAHAAASDAASRTAWLGCNPKAASDECVKSGIGSLLRRAYRRALTSDEIGRYVGLVSTAAANEGNDVWKGIEAALAAMLQSPNFLFSVNVGEPDPNVTSRIHYTGYEMGGRMALLLWDSVPDNALMAAADSGALATAEGIRNEADRLLADPRARRGVIAFGTDLLEADRLTGIKKDAVAFPRFTATLADSMRAEIEQEFASMTEQDSDYMDVYTTRTAFVNEELAALYGLSGVTGSSLRPVTLPSDSPRVGFLGSAGFLAVHAGPTEGSIIKRGVFMNERVLCRELGTPPAAAAMNGIETDMTGARTLRERTTATTSRAECTGCHSHINPLGFGLESFDGVGAYRTTDNGKPVDASGTLDGAAFNGEAELAGAIRSSDAAQHCVATQLYRYATGHKEDVSEQTHLDDLNQKFSAGGRRLRKLLVDLVAGDGFRYAERSEVP